MTIVNQFIFSSFSFWNIEHDFFILLQLAVCFYLFSELGVGKVTWTINVIWLYSNILQWVKKIIFKFQRFCFINYANKMILFLWFFILYFHFSTGFFKWHYFLLIHISLASFLWDIAKQPKPRSDAAEWGVWSGSPLFAYRIFYYNLNKSEKYHSTNLKREMDWSNY